MENVFHNDSKESRNQYIYFEWQSNKANHQCNFSNSLNNIFQSVQVTVQSHQAIRFLKYTKPFVRKARINEFLCENNESEIINTCAYLLNGISIRCISIEHFSEDSPM